MGTSEAGRDAIGGAALGTAVLPGWGTAIGGALGGLYGLFGDSGNQAPNVGAPNPYQGQWDALIKQLQARASGGAPSLAGQAYQAAAQTGLAQQAALSHGRSPGAAVRATTNMGNINQGMAQGYNQAQLAEELGNEQALTSALGGAQAGNLAPQSLALQKWQIQNGMDVSQMNALASILSASARMAPRSGGGATGNNGNGTVLQGGLIDPWGTSG